MLVWDDEVELDEDSTTIMETINGPLSASMVSPKPSVRTLPVQTPAHRRSRSQSASDPDAVANAKGSGFPPPVRRSTTGGKGKGAARPVPFASKLPRVHPGTSGVTVLEHMERVDAVEAGLRRLGVSEDVIEEEDEGEEIDVGVSVSSTSRPLAVQTDVAIDVGPVSSESDFTTPTSPVERRSISIMPGGPGTASMTSSMTEEDLVAMSRSTPTLLDSRVNAPGLGLRWPSDGHEVRAQIPPFGAASRSRPPDLDWIRAEEEELVKKRVVINEVC